MPRYSFVPTAHKGELFNSTIVGDTLPFGWTIGITDIRNEPPDVYLEIVYHIGDNGKIVCEEKQSIPLKSMWKVGDDGSYSVDLNVGVGPIPKSGVMDLRLDFEARNEMSPPPVRSERYLIKVRVPQPIMNGAHD
ncbi:hypothetical protein GX51_00891 [Blastomyces parvus]|uniref:Uncharacterized protein n=1 Tax=Blastomyces parvus TaxID=2060905 RepID=A0A2B7XKN3_9EURO|nr:hypothetical protein GX51_00891 [Blastomyces parvus]